jgi:hypothetical protein
MVDEGDSVPSRSDSVERAIAKAAAMGEAVWSLVREPGFGDVHSTLDGIQGGRMELSRNNAIGVAHETPESHERKSLRPEPLIGFKPLKGGPWPSLGSVRCLLFRVMRVFRGKSFCIDPLSAIRVRPKHETGASDSVLR